MIRKLIVPLLVLGAVATSLLAPAANAGSKEVYVENLKGAYALFYTEDGCYRLSGSIYIGHDATKVNTGERSSGTFGHGSVDVYDWCAKQWILMAEMGGEDVNVSIAQHLRSAGIDDTFAAYNRLADEYVSIHVALDWKGGERKYHDRDTIEVEYPGPDGTIVYSISRAGYHWVSAVVSGTITIDGHELSIQTVDADILGVKAVTHNTAK